MLWVDKRTHFNFYKWAISGVLYFILSFQQLEDIKMLYNLNPGLPVLESDCSANCASAITQLLFVFF